MVLKHNCLLWWKEIEDYQAGEDPWGYLDFNNIPPHITVNNDEIMGGLFGEREVDRSANILGAPSGHHPSPVRRPTARCAAGAVQAHTGWTAAACQTGGKYRRHHGASLGLRD